MIIGKDFEKSGLIKPVKKSKTVLAFPKPSKTPRRCKLLLSIYSFVFNV